MRCQISWQQIADAVRGGSFVLLFYLSAYLRAQGDDPGLIWLTIMAASVYLALDIFINRRKIDAFKNCLAIAIYTLPLAAFTIKLFSDYPTAFDESQSFARVSGISMIASCIAGSIVEEVIFRRHLLFQLQRMVSTNPAILLGALLFMLSHARISPSIFLFGVATGILVARFNCIYASIFIHALSNTFICSAILLRGPVDADGLQMTTALALHGSAASAFFASFVILLGITAISALLRYRERRRLAAGRPA